MTKKLRDLTFIILATSLVWIFYEIFSQLNKSPLPEIDQAIKAPFDAKINQDVIKNLKQRKSY